MVLGRDQAATEDRVTSPCRINESAMLEETQELEGGPRRPGPAKLPATDGAKRHPEHLCGVKASEPGENPGITELLGSDVWPPTAIPCSLAPPPL